MQLDSISPALNGRFYAHMKNGEKLVISRQYAPLFGILSAASELVTKSKKELSMGQMAFRLFLQLLIIEGIVFGANYFFGARENFTLPLNIALAIAIAVVFVIVYFVMWLNDRQSAIRFNEQLKIFQQQKNEQTF